MKKRTRTFKFKILFVFNLVFFLTITSTSFVSATDSVKFRKIADVSAGDGFDILVDEGEDLCYVSFGASGLKLYGITTINSPALISQIPEQNNGYAHQIQKIGDLVYVGDGRAGLTVLNYSVITSPQFQNQTLGYYGWSTTSNEDTLFLASGGDIFGYDTELVVFNITQRGQLELITEVLIPQTCVDVEITGDTLLITSEKIPLISFDISNVSNPIELDRTEENSGESFATDIEIVGNHAYVANWQGPFQIFDIEDPSNISLIYENEQFQDATCVESSGDAVFLADGTEGLVIFDVTNPEVPVIMGIYNDGRTQYRLDFADDYIFVTQQSYGFIILQLSERIIPGYGIPFIAIISLLCILFIYRGRRSRYVQR